MIEANGLYIGIFGGDPCLFRVEWYDDAITYLDYKKAMRGYVVAQPLSAMPPLQTIYMDGIEDISLLSIHNDHEADDDFGMWMSWSFDWAKLYIKWYQAKLRPYEYVEMFNDEVERQYASKN